MPVSNATFRSIDSGRSSKMQFLMVGLTAFPGHYSGQDSMSEPCYNACTSKHFNPRGSFIVVRILEFGTYQGAVNTTLGSHHRSQVAWWHASTDSERTG